MIHPDILQAVSEHYKATPPEVIRERLKESEKSAFAQTLNLLFEFSNSAFEKTEKEDKPKATVNPSQSKGEPSLA